jgi:hypothetical protein
MKKKIRADIGVKPLLGVTTYKGQKKASCKLNPITYESHLRLHKFS